MSRKPSADATVGAGLEPVLSPVEGPAPQDTAPEPEVAEPAVSPPEPGSEPLYRVYLSKSCPVDSWADPQTHLVVTKHPQDNVPARRLSATAWAELHVKIEPMTAHEES